MCVCVYYVFSRVQHTHTLSFSSGGVEERKEKVFPLVGRVFTAHSPSHTLCEGGVGRRWSGVGLGELLEMLLSLLMLHQLVNAPASLTVVSQFLVVLFSRHFSHFAIGKSSSNSCCFHALIPTGIGSRATSGRNSWHFRCIKHFGGLDNWNQKIVCYWWCRLFYYYFVELPLDFIRPSEWKSRNSNSNSTTAHRRQQQDKRDRGYTTIVPGERRHMVDIVPRVCLFILVGTVIFFCVFQFVSIHV